MDAIIKTTTKKGKSCEQRHCFSSNEIAIITHKGREESVKQTAVSLKQEHLVPKNKTGSDYLAWLVVLFTKLSADKSWPVSQLIFHASINILFSQHFHSTQSKLRSIKSNHRLKIFADKMHKRVADFGSLVKPQNISQFDVMISKYKWMVAVSDYFFFSTCRVSNSAIKV